LSVKAKDWVLGEGDSQGCQGGVGGAHALLPAVEKKKGEKKLRGVARRPEAQNSPRRRTSGRGGYERPRAKVRGWRSGGPSPNDTKGKGSSKHLCVELGAAMSDAPAKSSQTAEVGGRLPTRKIRTQPLKGQEIDCHHDLLVRLLLKKKKN